MLGVGPRIYDPELIDASGQDHAELTDSLRQVAQVNRLLGGTVALRRHLSEHVERSSATGAAFTVLDVGTGNGEVAADIENWANARGARCHVIGLDSHADVIRIASLLAEGRGKPTLVRGDALALPFADRAFDVACCTLTLHHFADSAAVRLVSELARVSRFSVIVNDLERTPLNYLSARLLSWTWWRRNRLTRHDGPISVLRSFTVRELTEIGRRADLSSVEVRRHFPFRLVLEGRPSGGAGQPPLP